MNDAGTGGELGAKGMAGTGIGGSTGAGGDVGLGKGGDAATGKGGNGAIMVERFYTCSLRRSVEVDGGYWRGFTLTGFKEETAEPS